MTPLAARSNPPPSAEEVEARLADLPMEDLVRAWRMVSTTSLKDQTAGTHAFKMYFDRLSHATPERGIAFIEAELASEPDDEIVVLLAEGKVLGQLLVFHAAPRRLRPCRSWLCGSRASAG